MENLFKGIKKLWCASIKSARILSLKFLAVFLSIFLTSFGVLPSISYSLEKEQQLANFDTIPPLPEFVAEVEYEEEVEEAVVVEGPPTEAPPAEEPPPTPPAKEPAKAPPPTPPPAEAPPPGEEPAEGPPAEAPPGEAEPPIAPPTEEPPTTDIAPPERVGPPYEQLTPSEPPIGGYPGGLPTEEPLPPELPTGEPAVICDSSTTWVDGKTTGESWCKEQSACARAGLDFRRSWGEIGRVTTFDIPGDEPNWDQGEQCSRTDGKTFYCYIPPEKVEEEEACIRKNLEWKRKDFAIDDQTSAAVRWEWNKEKCACECDPTTLRRQACEAKKGLWVPGNPKSILSCYCDTSGIYIPPKKEA